jgi:hypothetical protein
MTGWIVLFATSAPFEVQLAMELDLRYPVGPFTPVAGTPDVRRAAIAEIAALPAAIRAAVSGLDDWQLDTPYRPGGWTVRQLVHHVADSHMNGLIRLKLALTETHTTIKPYDENAWATLADARLPIGLSLGILDGVHERWAYVYTGMTDADYARTFVHPEHGKVFTIDWHTQMYGWHSRHHVAHITALRAREGW